MWLVSITKAWPYLFSKENMPMRPSLNICFLLCQTGRYGLRRAWGSTYPFDFRLGGEEFQGFAHVHGLVYEEKKLWGCKFQRSVGGGALTGLSSGVLWHLTHFWISPRHLLGLLRHPQLNSYIQVILVRSGVPILTPAIRLADANYPSRRAGIILTIIYKIRDLPRRVSPGLLLDQRAIHVAPLFSRCFSSAPKRDKYASIR